MAESRYVESRKFWESFLSPLKISTFCASSDRLLQPFGDTDYSLPPDDTLARRFINEVEEPKIMAANLSKKPKTPRSGGEGTTAGDCASATPSTSGTPTPTVDDSCDIGDGEGDGVINMGKYIGNVKLVRRESTDIGTAQANLAVEHDDKRIDDASQKGNGRGVAGKEMSDERKCLSPKKATSKSGGDSSTRQKQLSFERTRPHLESQSSSEIENMSVQQRISALSKGKKTRKRGLDKFDIDKPASQWTLDMIANYFGEGDVFESCFSPRPVEMSSPGKTFDEVKTRLSEVRDVLGVQLDDTDSSTTGLELMYSNKLSEADCRLILNSIIFLLCKFNDVRIATEQGLDSNLGPKCKYDYCFYKGDRCIGIMEAKSTSATGMVPKAVAQVIIQLFGLTLQVQKGENKSEREWSHSPFAILSNGFQYVFMRLSENYLRFECASPNGSSTRKILVNEAKTWENLKEIVEKINYLFADC